MGAIAVAQTNEGRLLSLEERVSALVAEVERLRGLIAATTETHEYCPWCGRHKQVTGHRHTCPAFTPEGDLK